MSGSAALREHLADLRQRRESLAQRSRGPLARQRGFKLLLLQEEELLCECELLLDGTAMAGELCRERVATRCAFDDAGLVARLRGALVRDAVDAAQLTQRLNELCARHEELQRLYPAPSDAERPARDQTEAAAPPAAPPVAKPVKAISPRNVRIISKPVAASRRRPVAAPVKIKAPAPRVASVKVKAPPAPPSTTATAWIWTEHDGLDPWCDRVRQAMSRVRYAKIDNWRAAHSLEDLKRVAKREGYSAFFVGGSPHAVMLSVPFELTPDQCRESAGCTLYLRDHLRADHRP